MSRLLTCCVLSATILLAPTVAQAEPGFAGTWETSFGPMYLQVSKGNVTGFYLGGGKFCPMQGTLSKSRWTFTYQEPTVKGEGHFDLSADGQSISGQWRTLGAEVWQPWTGHRKTAPEKPGGFPGVWATSFGRMRLVAGENSVNGCYAFPFGAKLEGKVKGNRYSFTYSEPAAHGEGWFELAADGRSFAGKWRSAGNEEWQDWLGVRI